MSPRIESINLLLQEFQTCNLTDLDGVKLMERVDDKYVVSMAQLQLLIPLMQSGHKLLCINGHRIQKYRTLYFDSPRFGLYLDHANGRSRRQKVRIREYANSGLRFLEVKHKRSELGTRKARIEISRESVWESGSWSDRERRFLAAQNLEPRVKLLELMPVMWTNFERLTFVDHEAQVRITLDLNLRMGSSEAQLVHLKDLAILEIKRPKGAAQPPILGVLRVLGIRKSSWSKYCMACVFCSTGLKVNPFKAQLKLMQKLGGYVSGRINPECR